VLAGSLATSEFGHAGLHAEGHFVLADAGVGLGVAELLA
jgi:hypothetical protein